MDELVLCNLHITVDIMLPEDLFYFCVRNFMSKFSESIFEVVHSDFTSGIDIKFGEDCINFLFCQVLFDWECSLNELMIVNHSVIIIV